MSIRGTVTLECDAKGCHAERVFDVTTDDADSSMNELSIELYSGGWLMDDDGLIHCPQCIESAREQVEKDAEIRACGGCEAWKSL